MFLNVPIYIIPYHILYGHDRNDDVNIYTDISLSYKFYIKARNVFLTYKRHDDMNKTPTAIIL